MPQAAATAPTTDRGRERILDEAATLFVERGYEATSLRHIADVVGMKAGSLYYHFASKDDLLAEILTRGIDVMQRAFDDAQVATTNAPAAAKVEAHVRAHLAALFENGPYTAAHVVTFRTAPAGVRTTIVPIRDAYEARWAELLSALQHDGLIDSTVDVHMARLVLFGAMNSSIEWFDPQRGQLDEFAHVITAQFWNGVAT